MKVREIMSEPVVTCTPDSTLRHAASLMRDADFGTLPVVDAAGHLVGIITDRDVCLAVAASGRHPGNIAVREVMTHKLKTVLLYDSVHTALAAMKHGRVRRLPVVDAEGQLKGLLSVEDIVVRALETGGIGTDEIVLTLRSLFERRPVEIDFSMV
jgi:CBS domain-containing protein